MSDDANGILHFVKDKNNLKNLGEAIEFIADKYEDDYMKLRPEFIKKMKRIEKQRGTHFKNIDELRKHIGLK